MVANQTKGLANSVVFRVSKKTSKREGHFAKLPLSSTSGRQAPACWTQGRGAPPPASLLLWMRTPSTPSFSLVLFSLRRVLPPFRSLSCIDTRTLALHGRCPLPPIKASPSSTMQPWGSVSFPSCSAPKESGRVVWKRHRRPLPPRRCPRPPPPNLPPRALRRPGRLHQHPRGDPRILPLPFFPSEPTPPLESAVGAQSLRAWLPSEANLAWACLASVATEVSFGPSCQPLWARLSPV
jgi:hypothetical protein